ncbi:hypothetical protein LH991_06885 [Schleiferilactobacillus harbinensis]|jgi:putative NADPH-quinone reductase|uniref:NAD(P)H-dependent oxidoreductase n=3 Tax=Schleiferilactobacillus harbinensis TaxID=304207 RepID=A0ABU7SXK5_9LACO|nr:NAD(P)H-dependent oxidoreductase [Schleiferilactobacillus harbinensis]KRM27958.1 NADPH-quinone reductase [Schleiferilactobacillus harbinensis DSM 16991]MCI1686736.1 NAD(P)H-dependent oxidoreductase [Schleiferilactobacillus harbinensis]MCI1784008.1 NAD(P)H-dependent oxidoreductase [Schleiferilactobacillus harbinensis]MCI1849555.1 NAD(P)H-dependent oxidoreductase [Schleiferilactobacillus harbinensis]QFR63716.1 hypothetical protein LH991_06885 [Schleiferilactobacillus harbinensis]
MRTLVLIGHPDLAHSGTQAFLQAAAGALTDADEWDISAQGVPDSAEILRLQGEMRRYDRLIFQFPLYWYSMPGVFKQWLDTVWTTPFVSGRPGEAPPLAGKELGIVVTFSQAQQDYRLGGREHFSLSELLRPIAALGLAAQMQLLPIFPVAQFGYMTERERQHLLVTYAQYLSLPAGAHFADRAQWFAAWLTQHASAHSDYAAWAAALTAQQEQLADLHDTLAEMRREEDDAL